MPGLHIKLLVNGAHIKAQPVYASDTLERGDIWHCPIDDSWLETALVGQDARFDGVYFRPLLVRSSLV